MCDARILDEFIGKYKNDMSLIEEIRQSLNKGNVDLEKLSVIKVHIDEDCSADGDYLFRIFLKTKIKAQTMLNLLLNSDLYKVCSMIKAADDSDNEMTATDGNSTADQLVSTILQFIVLFKILWKREMKQRPRERSCRYCDYELGEDDTKCSLCDADIEYEYDNPPISTNVPTNSWTDSQHDIISNNSNEIKVSAVEPKEEDATNMDTGGPAYNTTESKETRNNDSNCFVGFWTCPLCTFNNNPTLVCCVICFHNRIPPVETAAISNEDQSHIKDHITNGLTDIVDEVPYETDDNQWHCNECEYENCVSALKCFQCQNSNGIFVQCGLCNTNLIMDNEAEACGDCLNEQKDNCDKFNGEDKTMDERGAFPNDDSHNTTQPEEENWTCTHCTFVNDPSLLSCAICFQLRIRSEEIIPDEATAVEAEDTENKDNDPVNAKLKKHGLARILWSCFCRSKHKSGHKNDGPMEKDDTKSNNKSDSETSSSNSEVEPLINPSTKDQ